MAGADDGLAADGPHAVEVAVAEELDPEALVDVAVAVVVDAVADLH